ncbi:MAG: lysylphosphatidylglycerol synthase transmembrane domain-containing protein, partial [Dehalococcoidia bacterium]|nr:lysylphosphatidylglycerol synthase transmembrane domain-containing protein [Dehalococcoidia bacterium]
MKIRKTLPRLLGFLLLGILLTRIDRGQFLTALGNAAIPLVAAAVVLNVPGILVKALRWRWMLRAQGISYGVIPSSLAYFGSIFIGLLTPGRLGEFIKAVYVSRDCGVASGRAFSSVLADRIFDLYALMIVGVAALVSLGLADNGVTALAIGVPVVALVLPLLLLLNNSTFGWFQALGNRFGKLGGKLFGPEGWVVELRNGLKQLTLPWALLAVALTVLAYAVFYTQAYLLALALDINVGVVQVSYAVALGSLIT